MKRRERLENKLEKRREWAGKAEQRASARFEAAHGIADNIPLGQPILVGHHSERRHRRDIERMQNNGFAGVAETKLAEHHNQKADGLERQLENTIFSDDENAIEALQARIAENTALADKYRAAKEPAYRVTNLRARVRSDKKRLEQVKRRIARSNAAREAGGILVTSHGDYSAITFAEKPERSVLEELKQAGFSWSGGNWIGRSENLPEAYKEEKNMEKRDDPHNNRSNIRDKECNHHVVKS